VGNLPLIISVASFIVAFISFMGVVYGFAIWRGGVDKQLSLYSEGHLLDRTTSIETKIDVLWQIFTEQTLSNRPDLATRGSSFKLTDDAKMAVEAVKAIIPDINPGFGDGVAETVLVELPHRIGMDKVKGIAETHGMTLGELLAIISVELGLDL